MIYYSLLILLVLIIIIVILSQFKICPSGHMVVVYKKSYKNIDKPLIKIAKNKAFVPILTQGCIMILEGPIVLGIDLIGAMSKNKEPISISFIYTIEFSKKSEIVNAAIKNIANYNMKKLMGKIRTVISDTLYKEIANFPIKEIGNDYFKRTTNIAINKILNEIGFELKGMTINKGENEIAK